MSLKKTKLIIGDDEDDDEYKDPETITLPSQNNQAFKKPMPIIPPSFLKPPTFPIPKQNKTIQSPPTYQQPKQPESEAQNLAMNVIRKIASQNNGSLFNLQPATDRSKISSEESSFEQIQSIPKNTVPAKSFKSPLLNFSDSINESISYFNQGKNKTQSLPQERMVTESIQDMKILQTSDISPKPKQSKIKIVQQFPKEVNQHKNNSSKYRNTELMNCDVSHISHKTNNELYSQNPLDNSYEDKTNKTIKKQPDFVDKEDWIQANNPRLEWKNSKRCPLQINIMLKQLSKQASPNAVTELYNTLAVSEPLALSSRFSEYPAHSEIRNWAKEFPVYRRIRGDGNCFYRAFLFSFLEMALTNKSSLHFLKFLSCIANVNKVSFKTDYKNTKIYNNPNLSPATMRAFVIHRLLILYSYRVTLAEKGDPRWQQKIIDLLQEAFNERPYCLDTFLIIAIKNYAIYEVDKIEDYKDFDGMDVVKDEILQYGFECEMNQFPIRALSNGLGVCISLYQELKGNFRFESYGDKKRDKIILYYRPGHYDLVYPYKEVYARIIGK